MSAFQHFHFEGVGRNYTFSGIEFLPTEAPVTDGGILHIAFAHSLAIDSCSFIGGRVDATGGCLNIVDVGSVSITQTNFQNCFGFVSGGLHIVRSPFALDQVFFFGGESPAGSVESSVGELYACAFYEQVRPPSSHILCPVLLFSLSLSLSLSLVEELSLYSLAYGAACRKLQPRGRAANHR